MKKIDERRKFYILMGLVFVVASCFGIVAPMLGDDFWWHLKAGEWIAENGRVPNTGIFSWAGADLSWFAHEWLFEICIYGLSQVFGPMRAAYVCMFVCLLLIGAFVYACNYKDYLKNLKWYAGVLFMLSAMMAMATAARPHMLTLLLFSVLIWICERIKKDGSFEKFFFFMPLAVLWANWHGGSSNIMYIVPVLYFIGNCISFDAGRLQSRKITWPWRYLIFAACNALCIMVNPHGVYLYLYPYSYSQSQTGLIREWTPLTVQFIPHMAVVIIIALILMFTERELELSDLIIIGAFTALSFMGIRFVPWLAIVGAFTLSKYVENGNRELGRPAGQSLWAVCGLMCVAYLFIVAESPTYPFNYMKVLPDEVIETLKKEQPEHLYNSYDLGAYLIYNDIPVFVDGRADMYDGHNLAEAYHLSMFYQYDDLDVSGIVEKYGFDMFIDYKGSLIDEWLADRPDRYGLIYEGTDGFGNKIVIYKELK